VKKTASVYSDDKNRSKMDLVISGQVEKFVTIRPQHINLSGYAGDSVKALVSIIPEKKYPFKILKASAQDGSNLKFELEEAKPSADGAYELKVENLKQDAGRFYDTIILETDSKIQPQISVRVYANLRPRKSE
jgi:hypothetical protein